MRISDTEYLSKPLIENVRYNITDNVIEVDTDSTSYCRMKRIRYTNITEQELRKLYNEVVMLARSNKIKISFKKKTKELIYNNIVGYYENVKTANELFEQCKEVFQEVQKRGLHLGTLDDIVLEKGQSIKNKYGELFYYGTPYTTITDIYNGLNELKSKINHWVSDSNIILEGTKICI